MYKARCLLVEIEDKGWGGKSFKMNVIRCDLLLMKSSKSQESLTVIQTNTPQFPTNPRRTKQVFCLSNALVSDDEMRFYESLFSTSASCGAVFASLKLAKNHEKSPLRGLGRLHGIPKTNSSHLKIGRNPKGDVHLLQVVPGRVTPKRKESSPCNPPSPSRTTLW